MDQESEGMGNRETDLVGSTRLGVERKREVRGIGSWEEFEIGNWEL